MNREFSEFADAIRLHKYAHDIGSGQKETWADTSRRVAHHVMKAVNGPKSLVNELANRIELRQFIPGGRYLYAAGRPFHQVQNCLLLRAQDSREGWSDLLHKSSMALMTGAGIGVDYSNVRPEGAPIRKTGGSATGPIALMQMLNECGRGIMQGGSRRSAIWAGLRWSHPDAQRFVTLKNWIKEVRQLKEKDFNFPATMDGTNISIQLDDEFFAAYHNEKHKLHAMAQQVYWAVVRQMLKTGEPGFSIDLGESKEETLRNAPVAGGTNVLTSDGYKPVSELVGNPTTVWTGVRWAERVVFAKTQANAPIVKVSMTGRRSIRCEPTHEFVVERYHGVGRKRRTLVGIDRVKAKDLHPGMVLHVSLPNVTPLGTVDESAYTLGFLYGDGYFSKTNRAEIGVAAESKEPCLAYLKGDSDFLSSSVDARGITRVYYRRNDIRFSGRDKSAFPNEVYAANCQSIYSFIAGLFDADGNWDGIQKRLRLSSIHETFLVGVRRLLEQVGMLSCVTEGGKCGLSDNTAYQLTVMADSIRTFAEVIPTKRVVPVLGEWSPYRDSTIKVLSVMPDGVEDVYCADVRVPEHSFMAEGVIISNCTEVTSADDSDICNLGSINLARIDSLSEMKAIVELTSAFLVAGTVYSDVPYAKVDQIRTKNRRLGLGLMGIHEWLLKHGKKYGADEELAKYMAVYAQSTGYAHQYCDKWDLSRSVKTRAIAPTGTIGILAETTTGCEPIFCAAYKRRYMKGQTWNYQYVLDPTAKTLVDGGMNPDHIEDAYSIEPERRVAFQVWLQQFVDHGISSTINLPAWGSEANNEGTVQEFGRMLIKYLPNLRGITCYPDGARGGQPLSTVSYKTAVKHVGEIFTEAVDICDITKGGSCGS